MLTPSEWDWKLRSPTHKSQWSHLKQKLAVTILQQQPTTVPYTRLCVCVCVWCVWGACVCVCKCLDWIIHPREGQAGKCQAVGNVRMSCDDWWETSRLSAEQIEFCKTERASWQFKFEIKIRVYFTTYKNKIVQSRKNQKESGENLKHLQCKRRMSTLCPLHVHTHTCHSHDGCIAVCLAVVVMVGGQINGNLKVIMMMWC